MSQRRRVVPAILTNSAAELEEMVGKANGFASWVQFDIMDGLFVPPQSVFSAEIATIKPKFEYDIHLMVYHPESYFVGFRSGGARRITFHHEAVPRAMDWITYLKGLGLESGFALNPETPAEAVTKELAANVSAVLLLSVTPGYYGQPFIPEVLEKAKELRREYPELIIGMDGGIKPENITEIARAGVDEICVGSAIFGATDPVASYQELVALAEKGWQECSKNS